MKNRYMLISVIEREILIELFETKKEAQEKMREEIVRLAGIDEDIVAANPEYLDLSDGEMGWSENCGFVTDGRNHDNYDWVIVDLEEEEK